MKNHTFKKYYIAILEGILTEKEGTINAPISRKEGSIIEREISLNGSTAITHYKVLEESKSYSKVEFLLETGRTHQIRLHSRYIDHPIVGDSLYGNISNIALNSSLDRHLLHAYKIEFIHPISKQEITITSPIPEIFKEILSKK